MNTPEPEIIEAEIVEEPVPETFPASSADHARQQGDTSGVLEGMLVLVMGFLVTTVVILFSVFVLCPLLLLRRLWQLTFHAGPR